MKIYSIGARNFRTLEDFSIDLKSNYCAISGKNNSGKSAIIAIVEHFIKDPEAARFFPVSDRSISLIRDKTQWSNEDDMEITLDLHIDRSQDSELFYFIEKFSSDEKIGDLKEIIVRVSELFRKESENTRACIVNNTEIDHRSAAEILKKLRSSSTLVIHNSTNLTRNLFFTNSSYTEIVETHFSEDDRRRIATAQSSLQASLKKAAKLHREELEGLLGKLSERYHVELSAIPAGQSARYPLQIKLADTSADVPLNDWGSGTQNRTKILLSLLDAVRMRSSAADENRCTPVFLVEEPESFLHPSAQAEFGRVLSDLADELGIQIIATTHSPYMLNQKDPTANYLMDRHQRRKKPREAFLIDTTGEHWMRPFAENLGINESEFASWKPVFGVKSANILLGSGLIDHNQ